MKLAVLGGGGFRVPLVHAALLREESEGRGHRVREVVLFDHDPTRLEVVGHVIAQQAQRHTCSVDAFGGRAGVPVVTATTDLDEALQGADFVFSAVRVGGAAGRVADERVALALGVLGQETVGAGGIAFGLRTVPFALEVARRVREVSPGAWVINFTNPAGLVTQAMQTVLGDRVIGICDSPLGLVKRCAQAAGHPIERLDELEVDYAGLNHLGWLRGLRCAGVDGVAGKDGVAGIDLLPGLLADAERLTGFEEGRLFGAERLRALGAVPNEYLLYYYGVDDAIASIRTRAQTRGEAVAKAQEEFVRAVQATPGAALDVWDAARRSRNATYLQDVSPTDGPPPDEEGGGYEGVALALVAALARDEAATLILNVRNGSGSAGGPRSGVAVPGLSADAVVEVPCRVTAAGPVPQEVTPLSGDELDLVRRVKACDELVIRAAVEGSPAVAIEALARHPLVGSADLAERLLAGYRATIPELDAVFAPDRAGGLTPR